MAKYTPMIQQYLSIKKNYPDAFLFFRLGDFYELFFEDAIQAARELEITLTGREGGTEERIPMCGVPHHSAESYISQLINKGYKVAICEQVEDPKEAKGVVKREVVRVITPGTVMEGKMLEDKKNNFIVAVVREGESLGVASCDVTTGEFYATILDDEPSTLLNELSYYHPSEIVVEKEEVLQKIKGDLQQQFSAVITLFTLLNGEGEGDGDISVEQHFQNGQALSAIHKKSVALLFGYLKETQKRSLEHLKRVDVYESRQYMILDAFSRRNLELTETVRDHRKKGSLLWLLDRTSTAMGGRLLRKWIEKPLIRRDWIEERLQAVSFLIEQWMARDELKDLLQQIYDLERLAGRVAYGNANARDLVQLKRSLSVIPAIKNLLLTHSETISEEAARNQIQRIVSEIDECSDVKEMLETALVDDPPFSVREGGMIRSGFHEHLDKLLEASRSGKKWISELEQRERALTGIKSLKVGYNKVFGYYIEITRANLGAVPEDRFIRKQTLANAERFVTPELKEKEALIMEAEEKSVELEYQLFVELRDKVASQIQRIQKLAHQVARWDVLQAFASVSQENGYVKPTILDMEENRFDIEEARHPVVESVLEEESFVPNDICLNHKDNQILLITGPNMAGKSTYMRQVALTVIMAQIGCYVPARRADLSVVDRIFTRIGAADDLAGGQSTFMVEMNDIKLTTVQATRHSLIIVDELGRGTSTTDGMAIAQAVIEYIHDRIGCVALVSTHYHELASLENHLPRLKNVSMAVTEEEEEVIFLRRLQEGAASKSYGIYCAQIAGVPGPIVQRAQSLLQVFEKQQQEIAVAQDQTAVQLDIFGETVQSVQPMKVTEPAPPKSHEKVIKKLREIDLIHMTPLEAMNTLDQLKKMLD